MADVEVHEHDLQQLHVPALVETMGRICSQLKESSEDQFSFGCWEPDPENNPASCCSYYRVTRDIHHHIWDFPRVRHECIVAVDVPFYVCQDGRRAVVCNLYDPKHFTTVVVQMALYAVDVRATVIRLHPEYSKNIGVIEIEVNPLPG